MPRVCIGTGTEEAARRRCPVRCRIQECWVGDRRGIKGVSVRLYGDLMEKEYHHVGGVLLEVLVRLDEESGHDCGEQTRLRAK